MSIEVYHELEKKDHEVFAWVKERKDILCREIDNWVQAEVIRLMRAYPRLVDTKKGKSGGDPFVLAQALAGDPRLVVVSEEKGGSENQPQDTLRLRTGRAAVHSLLALIEEEDWSF